MASLDEIWLKSDGLFVAGIGRADPPLWNQNRRYLDIVRSPLNAITRAAARRSTGATPPPGEQASAERGIENPLLRDALGGVRRGLPGFPQG
jgi:hypothetical protein